MISEAFHAVQTALYEQANSGNYSGVVFLLVIFAFGPGVASFIATHIGYRIIIKSYNRSDERVGSSYTKHLDDLGKQLDEKQKLIEMHYKEEKRKNLQIEKLIKEIEKLKK